MAASILSPADLSNVSLRRIGYKLRVSNLFEGSHAAKVLLDLYSQTRDELMRSKDWGFAERNVSPGLLKSAPQNGYLPPNFWDPAIHPALPWVFSYTYPADCLKVRAVKASPIFVPNFDPQPNVFSVENDQTYAPPQKAILCNVPSMVLTYTGQITDPATWEADFAEAFAAALGRRLAPALVGLDAAKLELQDEAAETALAETRIG